MFDSSAYTVRRTRTYMNTAFMRRTIGPANFSDIRMHRTATQFARWIMMYAAGSFLLVEQNGWTEPWKKMNYFLRRTFWSFCLACCPSLSRLALRPRYRNELNCVEVFFFHIEPNIIEIPLYILGIFFFCTIPWKAYIIVKNTKKFRTTEQQTLMNGCC